MPVPSERYIKSSTVRNFGTLQGGFDLSDLTQIQTESYARFLQLDRRPDQRRGQGLEEILREVFPVVSNIVAWLHPEQPPRQSWGDGHSPFAQEA